MVNQDTIKQPNCQLLSDRTRWNLLSCVGHCTLPVSFHNTWRMQSCTVQSGCVTLLAHVVWFKDITATSGMLRHPMHSCTYYTNTKWFPAVNLKCWLFQIRLIFLDHMVIQLELPSTFSQESLIFMGTVAGTPSLPLLRAETLLVSLRLSSW